MEIKGGGKNDVAHGEKTTAKRRVLTSCCLVSTDLVRYDVAVDQRSQQGSVQKLFLAYTQTK